MGSGTFASTLNNDELKIHPNNKSTTHNQITTPSTIPIRMNLFNCSATTTRRGESVSKSKPNPKSNVQQQEHRHSGNSSVDHSASSSSESASPSQNSPTSTSMSFIGPSSVSTSSANQSKENFELYNLSVDYDRDDSTQSSNLTLQSKGSSLNLNVSGHKLTRSKTRHIFSSSEKFQSHPDLKDLYDKEEEQEREEQQNEINSISNSGHGSNTTNTTDKDTKLYPTKFFGRDIKAWTNGSPDEPIFDNKLRNFIDVHISKARKTREEKYNQIIDKIMGAKRNHLWNNNPPSVASNSYVPYPALRHERRFLYDVETYPLHQHLADILNVDDLSLIHKHPIQDKKTLMKPLLDSKKRLAFHRCYDNFVTSFCIPLLHSFAMSENLFNDSRNDNDGPQRKISYRYQAFPCIRVNRPGEFSIGPHCDMSYGHSMGNINFHIPLTPTYGTNALYTESHPGREDWHPLKTKAIGLGYVFDGARCIHYTMENTTRHSRVSLDFRIAIHRETIMQLNIPSYVTPSNAKMMMEYSILMKKAIAGENEDKRCYDVHDVLCNKKMLQDSYSSFPGYYEEAFVDLGTCERSVGKGHGPGPVVCKRNGSGLMQPDKRVGFPF